MPAARGGFEKTGARRRPARYDDWRRVMNRASVLSVLLVFSVFPASLRSQISLSPALPEAVGLNIHITDPLPGEMSMLAKSGVRWVRMDFRWNEIETTKGHYNFAAYDRLLAAIERYKIRPLFILCYSNPLYDEGLSPYSDQGRQAFVNWVMAAVKHFQGHGIVWEMYNEPNWHFWKPRPNVDNYIKLALAVGEAMRETAPQEIYVGPATAVIDPPYVEACLKAGLLNYWSAVSVHPYRQADPETAAADYRALRLMIAKYGPRGKPIPVIAGEWGYSSVWPGMDEEKQGQMLAREWLTDLASGVPLSIWYDWRDDGTDARNPEHHFGIIRNPYQNGLTPVYQPKPAYRAARTLTALFRGEHFNKRLAVGGDHAYVLLFSNGPEIKLAAWTTAAGRHTAVIPASPGWFDRYQFTGEKRWPIRATRNGLAVSLTGAPQYFIPRRPNALLQIAAGWQPVPLEIATTAPAPLHLTLQLQNPLARPIRVREGRGGWKEVPPGGQIRLTTTAEIIQRSVDPVPVRTALEVSGIGHLAQVTDAVVSNLLRLTALPAAGRVLPVAVANPSGEAFRGVVAAWNWKGLGPDVAPATLDLKPGETGAMIRLRLRAAAGASYRLGLKAEDTQRRIVVLVPARRFVRVDDLSLYRAGSEPRRYQMLVPGEPKHSAEESLGISAAPAGLPASGMASLKIIYHLTAGRPVLCILPAAGALQAIQGRPQSLGWWIDGDGVGNALYVRFVDATGQTFQAGGSALDWKGWRYVTFLLDSIHATHWGGKDDGRIHYPIHWDCLFMLSKAIAGDSQGTVYMAAPTLIY